MVRRELDAAKCKPCRLIAVKTVQRRWDSLIQPPLEVPVCWACDAVFPSRRGGSECLCVCFAPEPQIDRSDPQRYIKGFRPVSSPGFLGHAINMLVFDPADVHLRHTLFFYYLRDTLVFDTEKHMDEHLAHHGTHDRLRYPARCGSRGSDSPCCVRVRVLVVSIAGATTPMCSLDGGRVTNDGVQSVGQRVWPEAVLGGTSCVVRRVVRRMAGGSDTCLSFVGCRGGADQVCRSTCVSGSFGCSVSATVSCSARKRRRHSPSWKPCTPRPCRNCASTCGHRAWERATIVERD